MKWLHFRSALLLGGFAALAAGCAGATSEEELAETNDAELAAHLVGCQNGPYRVVRNGDVPLRFRSQPYLGAPVRGFIPMGTTLEHASMRPVPPQSPWTSVMWNGETGWVHGHYLDCAPKPPPPPSPVPFHTFRARFFHGADRQGPILHEREDKSIDFNWYANAPAPNVPDDNFSAEWIGRWIFPGTGNYDFHVVADDGVRIFIDGQRVFESWQLQVIDTTFKVNVGLGEHEVRVEYMELQGWARLHLDWQKEPEKKLCLDVGGLCAWGNRCPVAGQPMTPSSDGVCSAGQICCVPDTKQYQPWPAWHPQGAGSFASESILLEPGSRVRHAEICVDDVSSPWATLHMTAQVQIGDPPQAYLNQPGCKTYEGYGFSIRRLWGSNPKGRFRLLD